MKKIVLFGPFGPFGGRELEASFIASVLSSHYEVDICTSSSVTKKSQLFDFNKKQKVFSIKDLLCQRYFNIRILALVSYFKNHFKGVLNSYANNIFAKRYLDYDKKVNIVLNDLILEYDVVLICAQLCSGLIDDVISIANNNNKKVIFRTTGTITSIDFDFIDKVDCFIHHSVNNAQKIESYRKHNFVIIDQCAYDEERLLTIPYSQNDVKTFLTISRLVEEKNIDKVIKAFQKTKRIGDKLFVVGNGAAYDELIKIADADEDIIFTGFVSNKDLYKYFSLVDCVIISHFEFETGPLTGIEAMACARLIISAQTGAMKERLPFNKFWFNNTIEEIAEQINLVKELDASQVSEISKKNRDKYLEEYSIKKIEQKYLNVIDNIFSN